jgi:hypothetical protein
MYITDSTSQLEHNRQTGRVDGGSSGKIVFLLSRLSSVIRRCDTPRDKTACYEPQKKAPV